MDELRLEVEVQAERRKVPCFLCGRLHQRPYAGVGLYEAGSRLGPVGPDCLAGGPGAAAERARRQAARLAEQAAALAGLAERIARLERWPVTPQQLREAEWHQLHAHFPGLRDDVLRRVIEEVSHEAPAADDAGA